MSGHWMCGVFGHKKAQEHLLHGSYAYCKRCGVTLDNGDYNKGFPNRWWLWHLATKILICDRIGHAMDYSGGDINLWGGHCKRCGGSYLRTTNQSKLEPEVGDTL